MTVFSEARKAGDFVLSRDPGAVAYGLLAAGQSVGVGAVLGSRLILDEATVTVTTAADNAVDSGSLTMDAAPLTTAARRGDYVVYCVEAGPGPAVFDVQDDEGRSIGTARSGALFAGPVRFTNADGENPFGVGDHFTIAVRHGLDAIEYVELDPEASDGSQIAAAVSFGAAQSDEDRIRIMIVGRGASVSAPQLAWPAGISDAAKKAAEKQLSRAGIIVRR